MVAPSHGEVPSHSTLQAKVGGHVTTALSQVPAPMHSMKQVFVPMSQPPLH
jgi:hypothetical protein